MLYILHRAPACYWSLVRRAGRVSRPQTWSRARRGPPCRFYRELRSALVDMEDFFAILRTKSNLVDGASALPAQPPQAAAAEALGAATAAVAAAPSSNGTGNGAAAHVSGAAGEEAAASGGLLVELEDVHFGYSPDRQVTLTKGCLMRRVGQSLTWWRGTLSRSCCGVLRCADPQGPVAARGAGQEPGAGGALGLRCGMGAIQGLGGRWGRAL